jgi:type I restriction enzyme S subunit
MSKEFWDTPESWAWSTLDFIAEWASGGTPKSTEPKFYNGDIPWLVIGDLNDRLVTSSAKTITSLGLKNSSAKMVQKGAILIAMYGSIGKLGIAGIECATNQAIAFTESVHSEVEVKYLFYYLRHARTKLNEIGKGGAQQNISQTVIKDFPICIAPLNEQRRIVTKLEKLLSRVDAAQARLATIPRILKRFRQSVLAAACSGKLTADWRERGLPVESSRDLFKTIKESKENLIAKKLIKNEQVLPAITEEDWFFDIPQNWHWVRLGDICSHIADIDHKMPKAVEQGVKFLSAKDLLDDGSLNLTENIKLISEEDYLRLSRKIKPQRDDVIYSRIGARLGKARLVQTDEKFLVSYSCCVIRPLIVEPAYIARFLDSAVVLSRAISDAQSIGVPDLGIQKIKEFAIPLAPLAEQQEIVRRVEALFKTADALEARYRTAKGHVDKLTQSILARAFRGELVITEAELARLEGRDYEPASVLLERIRQERAQQEASKQSKPKHTPKSKKDTATKKMFA